MVCYSCWALAVSASGQGANMEFCFSTASYVVDARRPSQRGARFAHHLHDVPAALSHVEKVARKISTRTPLVG